MITPRVFTDELLQNDLGPVVEVPCSYLKSFLEYLWDTKVLAVMNPVNEALALGMASGAYLATGKIPIVAIQNSGLMNTLNGLTSLNQIYDIPVFYLTTWRGEGGKGADAPEHDVTGAHMEKILQTFELPYELIDEKRFPEQIQTLTKHAAKTQKPVALIIKKKTFAPYEPSRRANHADYEMSRYEAMKLIKEALHPDSVFLSTTGFPSRDSFAIKDTPDFYIVGSMGHAFSIALGVAPYTTKRVVVFDGDGGALMHAGGLGSFDPHLHKNILYVVLDNEAYESTGGQPTVSSGVDFSHLAKAFRFPRFARITKANQLRSFLQKLPNINGAVFLHIKIRSEPGRTAKRVSDVYSCPQIKERFIEEFQWLRVMGAAHKTL